MEKILCQDLWILLIREFHEMYHKTLQFYFQIQFFTILRCTGEIGTQECSLTAAGASIIPPIISAKINTKEKFSFKYGKVEVSAKLPEGNWIYPGYLLT